MARLPNPRPVPPEAPPGCRYISLTRGKFALVDEADYEWLMRYNWHASFIPAHGVYYAARTSHSIKMHNEILGVRVGADHVNRDTLDNRRVNLRPATVSQNNINQRRRKDNVSGFKGVSVSGKKWKATIRVQGKTKYLGTFDEPVTAARVYDNAARVHHKEFAVTNFPQESV